MRSYKADIDESYCKFYYGNYAVSIPLNVKDISLISYSVRAVKGLFNICKACPMTVFYYIHPYLEWKKCVWMCLCKLFQCLFCKNPHQ